MKRAIQHAIVQAGAGWRRRHGVVSRWMTSAVAALVLAAGPAAGEIIDRIAVTVENSVITESELMRQIRLTALLNGSKPDYSSANKREIADKLIEQTIIRREINTTRYIANNMKQAESLYEEFRSRFKAAEEYQRTLREYGVTDGEVRDAFLWQSTLLEFIDVRFRPGIQVPESELRDYFETEVKPKATGTAIDFEDVRDDIEEILTEQRVDNALDRWLGQARTQMRIVYKEEVFE
jgi:hypothetical protein